MLHHVRLLNLLIAGSLILIGLAILLGASFEHAEAVGGLVAGAGAGALLTELTSIKERATASLEAERLRLTLARMDAAAIFARFRTAAELGALATQCLFGSAFPSPDAASRFQALSDALDLGIFGSRIPPAGSDREKEGYALYKQIKQALADRHGESVAAAFAFVFAGGIVTGGSGTVDSELANKLRETLFDLPDEWLKTYVDLILRRWEQGDAPTALLQTQLNNVYFWLMNYGSRRPEVLETEAILRAV